MGRWYHAKRVTVKSEGRLPAGEIRKIRLRTGFELEVRLCGAAGAALPLVLVPGVGGNKELFSSIVGLLARDRRVVAVDLSPVVARGSSVLSSAVEDFLEVLDALGLTRFELLGQSFGALISVRAARVRSAAVRRLVLAGPATIPSSWAAPGIFARWLAMGAMIRVWPPRLRPTVARLVRHTGGFALEPELAGGAFDDLVTRVRAVRVLPLVRRLLAVRGHPWRRELAEIAVPLLIIEGDREAALLPRDVLVYFAQRPNTTYVEMKGGHMPFLVRPEEFVARVREFLDEPPVTAAAQR
jgi:pimeloyl-ACP methyl ester carboxylesterase